MYFLLDIGPRLRKVVWKREFNDLENTRSWRKLHEFRDCLF